MVYAGHLKSLSELYQDLTGDFLNGHESTGGILKHKLCFNGICSITIWRTPKLWPC